MSLYIHLKLSISSFATFFIVFIIFESYLVTEVQCSWDDWWTYDGISGPDFWGLLNPEWHLCSKGRRQSPIDIRPEQLLFDDQLQPFQIGRQRVSGSLINNGHSIVFKLDQPSSSNAGSDMTTNGAVSTGGVSELDAKINRADQLLNQVMGESGPGSLLLGELQTSSLSEQLGLANAVSNLPTNSFGSLSAHLAGQFGQSGHTNDVDSIGSAHRIPMLTISGGPLSYSYTVHSLHLHFGRTDELGSEHFISGFQFPAEIQIVGFNSDLYQNISEASSKSNGLVAISLLTQIGNSSNSELQMLINLAQNIKHRGDNVTLKSISLIDLLPNSISYMTYEGSLTTPGCQETVTWIVLNRPILITRQQLYQLRKLMQGEPESPKAPLGNNFRPIQPINHRFVRTNIDFQSKDSNCLSMRRNMQYQVNVRHLRN